MRQSLLFVFLLAACQSSPPPTASTAPAVIEGPAVVFAGSQGDVGIGVTLATTPAEHEKGLTGVASLGANAGMLFVFDDDQDRTFWTKKTAFRVDFIFIDLRLDVVGVAANVPANSETTRAVGRLSRFVLETNAGWAGAHGVATGAKARFERIPGLN